MPKIKFVRPSHSVPSSIATYCDLECAVSVLLQYTNDRELLRWIAENVPLHSDILIVFTEETPYIDTTSCSAAKVWRNVSMTWYGDVKLVDEKELGPQPCGPEDVKTVAQKFKLAPGAALLVKKEFVSGDEEYNSTVLYINPPSGVCIEIEDGDEPVVVC